MDPDKPTTPIPLAQSDLVDEAEARPDEIGSEPTATEGGAQSNELEQAAEQDAAYLAAVEEDAAYLLEVAEPTKPSSEE
ncbi:MAG: hypothetical protein Q9191_005573, partial [Dirinaria sp. TL-2023a]